MLRHLPLFFLLTLLLSACASLQGKSRVVIMQHPETMDFQNCEVDRIGLDKAFADNEACVKDYQSKGYIIWGER